MSKKIIGIIRPFDFKQKIIVYDNNNPVATTEATFEDFNDTIFSLSEQYEAKQVDLTGPKQYNRGLAKKLKEAELNKYDENTLEVNVI